MKYKSIKNYTKEVFHSGNFAKLFFYSLIFLFSFSCLKPCDGREYKFRLRLEIILEQDDIMTISYLHKNQNKQTNRVLLRKEIKGNSDNQFVEFCFPDEPKDLLIFFSGEKTINNLKISSALFENQENQFFIKGEMFHMYFVGNKNVKYLKDSNTYDFITNVDQKAFLMSRNPMNKRLKNKLKP